MNNVKKVLIRLSKKKHRIPILLELKNRAISEAKRTCVDAAVQMMVEVQQEQKVAAKNMVIHQSREELGLHLASKPTGSMIKEPHSSGEV